MRAKLFHPLVPSTEDFDFSDGEVRMKQKRTLPRLALYVSASLAVGWLASRPGHAYQPGTMQPQPAAPNVEAAEITPMFCQGQGEVPNGLFRIYHYTARPAGNPTFRVIIGSDWGHAAGGRDLTSWQDAEKLVLQGCKGCPINPDEDAVAAKRATDAAYLNVTRNPSDAANLQAYACHKAVLEYLQRTSRPGGG